MYGTLRGEGWDEGDRILSLRGQEHSARLAERSRDVQVEDHGLGK